MSTPAAAASAFENAPRANIARMMTSGTVRNAATNGIENNNVKSNARPLCLFGTGVVARRTSRRDLSGNSTVPIAIPITPMLTARPYPRVVPHLDPAALLADLDPEQREAVRRRAGPVAIHAGAGSGKTRVISRRTAYAIATDVVPADQVLVVTFTDKAADGDGRRGCARSGCPASRRARSTPTP